MQGTPANSGRQYRLYPTLEQAERLTAWGHTCRAIWNIALEQRQFAWEQRRHTMRAFEQNVHLTQARAEMEWLNDLPAQSAREVLRHLDRAYDNWWNPQHLAGRPKRKKRTTRLSVFFTGQRVSVRKLNSHWGMIRLPKIGWIRFRMSRALGGEVRTVTIKTNSTGRWQLFITVAFDRKAELPNGKPGCGVDFGIACAAYVSDENTPRIMAPTLTPGEQKRLLGLERRAARQLIFAERHNRRKRSRRLQKSLGAIADLRGRRGRRRLDFTHKLTTDLTKNHGWVAIEDLKLISMTKKPAIKTDPDRPGSYLPNGRSAKAGLNRAIRDNIPGERRRQLEYKAPLYGSELRVVPAPFTSQTCSACGAVDKKNRPGCGREFACTACGFSEHADKNAAINIAEKARRAAGLNSTRRHDVPSPRETGRRLREPLGHLQLCLQESLFSQDGEDAKSLRVIS